MDLKDELSLKYYSTKYKYLCARRKLIINQQIELKVKENQN